MARRLGYLFKRCLSIQAHATCLLYGACELWPWRCFHSWVASLEVLLLLCAVLPWTLVVRSSSFRGERQVDSQYPGTALERLKGIHLRVKTLTSQDLSADWQEVRRQLLWAGGLRDLPDVPPGQGCTKHSFNDDTHCDLTAMLGASTVEMIERSVRPR